MDLSSILDTAPTPAPDPQRALLSKAIQNSTLERLRVTLQSICDDSPEAFNLASHQLLAEQNSIPNEQEVIETLHKQVGESGENEDEEGWDEKEIRILPTPAPASHGQKRKLNYTRQRYETCAQCGREYDCTENEKGGPTCWWHDGQ
jgi:hypothetical protein